MAELLQLLHTPEPWLVLLAAAAVFLLLGRLWTPPRLSRGWRKAGEGWAILIVTFGALVFVLGLITLGPLFLLPRRTWDGIAQSLFTLWLTPSVLLLAAWLILGHLDTDERYAWAGWLAVSASLLGFVVLNNWLLDAAVNGTMLFAWAGALLGGVAVYLQAER